MKVHVATLCICTVYLSNFVLCRPPISLQLEHKESDDVIELPYYGGAKGQVLQIKTSPDGSVISEIVKQKLENIESNDYRPHLPVHVNSLLNSVDETNKSSFVYNLNSIKISAQKLVDLQQTIKHSGHLSNEQQKIYAENLEIIGNSAQELVKTERDEPKMVHVNKINDAKKNILSIKTDNDEEHDGGDENTDDSVQVNSPSEDASVAEAKPIGLAIAGIGGVASSKPVATAIVGPGGLAVAKPVATAIAGVPPSEVAGLGIPYPGKKKNPSSIGIAEKTEYLPGKFYVRE